MRRSSPYSCRLVSSFDVQSRPSAAKAKSKAHQEEATATGEKKLGGAARNRSGSASASGPALSLVASRLLQSLLRGVVAVLELRSKGRRSRNNMGEYNEADDDDEEGEGEDGDDESDDEGAGQSGSAASTTRTRGAGRLKSQSGQRKAELPLCSAASLRRRLAPFAPPDSDGTGAPHHATHVHDQFCRAHCDLSEQTDGHAAACRVLGTLARSQGSSPLVRAALLGLPLSAAVAAGGKAAPAASSTSALEAEMLQESEAPSANLWSLLQPQCGGAAGAHCNSLS